MDPLAFNAVAPVTLAALRPVQALTTPAAQTGGSAGTLQGQAQGLFQQALQVTGILPLAGQPVGLDQAQETTASLLASLNAPQAAATTTALGVTATAQDALTNTASLDFALQTALRFGAGVGPLAAPAIANPGQGTGLVRDATQVLRIRNLQPQTGGPGPEAFAQPHAPVQRVLRSYQAVPAAPTPGQVDLFA